jgi:hypothetical protein
VIHFHRDDLQVRIIVGNDEEDLVVQHPRVEVRSERVPLVASSSDNATSRACCCNCLPRKRHSPLPFPKRDPWFGFFVRSALWDELRELI